MINLNLNVDHFATLRNARGGTEPDPTAAAVTAELAGATGIVTHLRKDRRHINENDVRRIKNAISIHLNLEMSCDNEIVEIACSIKPKIATLVPEQPNEITTSGGLNVITHKQQISDVIKKLHNVGSKVSLFVEPDRDQVETSIEIGADNIEFNTLQFALAHSNNDFEKMNSEISRINSASKFLLEHKIFIAAGHSLNYLNVKEFSQAYMIQEYNIGHSIVSRSCFVGLPSAIKEMNELLLKYRTLSIAMK
jgi:pyridoxine 5-phosphate synthase